MKTTLSYNDTKDIFEKYGFPVPRGGHAKTEDGAVEIASRIGFPVILKSSSRDVSETSVLNSSDEIRREYQQILKNATQNLDVIVQSHTEHGMEALVGMTRDPELGPIVTFGLSGVFAFLKDVSSRVAPVSKEDAIEMIKETGAYEIIKGDGKKKSDIEAIADVIEKVSRLSVDNDEITEIEINPLFLYEKGAAVINAQVAVG
jgi:acetyl-CoA synthetase (ADP-forming)